MDDAVAIEIMHTATNVNSVKVPPSTPSSSVSHTNPPETLVSLIRADISPTQNRIITIVTAVDDPIPLVTADQYAEYGLANSAPTSSARTPPAASAVMSNVLNTTKKTTQNARNTTTGKNASALPPRKARCLSALMVVNLSTTLGAAQVCTYLRVYTKVHEASTVNH
ncbi:hypothetical protein OH735_10305 [Streptomyces sp. NBC_01618]|nr:hypothetical protein OH735_10305 [Streptomyces sp. NBC_01618]